MGRFAGGVIGATLGVIAVWAIAQRRRDRSFSFRTTAGSRPWRNWPQRASEDAMDAMQLQHDPLVVIDRSPLVRVIGVGQSQSADGATIECVSIEVREAGCRGLLRVLLLDAHALLWWLADDDAIALAGFVGLPVTLADAEDAGRLPAHHRDPFDRMLIAQANRVDAVIATRDTVFAAYGVDTLSA